MKIGSLCTGIGGLDLAVERLFDAELEWYCEVEKAPAQIMKAHYPTVRNYGDITSIAWDCLPPVDILTGGTPCQDVSIAGKRAGMTEGTRSNLWTNMRDAINIIRPQFVVWENVKAVKSAKAFSESDLESDDGQMGNLKALGRILGDLAELGYDAEWTTLRALDIGAPHWRPRVFLLATTDSPNPALADRNRNRLQAG